MGPVKRVSLPERLLNFVEFLLPSVLFLLLFFAFLWGVICRYVLNAPQSWTYEMSSVCFLAVVILSICIADRENAHVCFDMFYAAAGERMQRAMRLLGDLLVFVTALILLPVSVEYLVSMRGLQLQFIPISRWVIFTPFPITFLLTAIRGCCKLLIELGAMKHSVFTTPYYAKVEEKR